MVCVLERVFADVCLCFFPVCMCTGWVGVMQQRSSCTVRLRTDKQQQLLIGSSRSLAAATAGFIAGAASLRQLVP